MKPRYIRQKTNWDCGPTALINVLKWAGCKSSYKKHGKYLNSMCREEGQGSSIFSLHAALTHLKKKRFRFRYDGKPTLKSFINHLQDEGCVMFIYWSGRGYHVALITETTRSASQFLFVNPFEGHTTYKISRTRLKMWLRAERPVAWLIHRYSRGAV